MKENQVLQIFKDTDALITDSHIVYTSGKHGSVYVNKDAVYPHTKKIHLLCRELAKQFLKDEVDIVIAPAIGGVVLSQRVTDNLSGITGRYILSVYAEKAENNSFVIKRGYDKLVAGKNVLVLEDILSTGGSVKKVIQEVRKIGGNVVGVGALWNRGGVTVKDLENVPKLFCLVNKQFDTYEQDDCPLCKAGVVINVEVGKGKEYLNNK